MVVINHESVCMSHAMSHVSSALHVGVPDGQVLMVVFDYAGIMSGPDT